MERAIELAQACENAAFAVDKRLTNSEGATVSLQQSHFAYGNSLGFLGGYPSSRHWISCAVIAGKGDAMQRDDWYTSARDPAALDAPACASMCQDRICALFFLFFFVLFFKRTRARAAPHL